MSPDCCLVFWVFHAISLFPLPSRLISDTKEKKLNLKNKKKEIQIRWLQDKMPDKNKILKILSNNKRSFAERFGITAIGIFGSLARNEAIESSDVDVVVQMKKPDLFYLVHIKEELQDACHTTVDIVHYREKMNQLLKRRIDSEAIYV